VSSHLKWILPLAALALGAALATIIFATRPQVEARPTEAAAPLVRVVEARVEPVQLTVRTHGTVAPRTESDLVPEVSGPVIWVSPSLASGGFFEAGEPLLRIDPTDFDVALEQARASLARAESEAARARKELQRQRTLAAQNVTSASRLDDAENATKVAEATLRQTRATLRKAQHDMERTEIRAAYQGRVREEHVDVGQFVSRGSPVATLYAVDYAEVRLPISDQDLAFIDLPLRFQAGMEDTPGPEVVISAEFAGRPHQWKGAVVRTEGEIDPRSRMVHVVARFDDPYGGVEEGRPPLNVGLFVEAEITGRRLERAVVLPREALRDDSRVLVVDAEDRLRFRDIKLARVDRDQIVVSEGLEAGERVCVSPLAVAVDGMPVRAVVQGGWHDGSAS
jgi:RND family efflux transporter MFP subunit